jgi:flagella basal body P-ring formation protein FlgA
MKNYLSTFAAFVALGSACATAGEIWLRDHAAPVGSIVRLADVADLRGFDDERSRQLALVELFAAPPVASTRYLSRVELRDLLARHGRETRDIGFEGAEAVVIAWPAEPNANVPATTPSASGVARPPTSGFRNIGTPTRFARPAREPIVLSQQQIDAIADHLREVITYYVEDTTGKVGTIEVECQLPLRDAERLVAATSELTISGGRTPYTGYQLLQVSAETDDGTLTLPLRVRVRDMTPVAILTRGVARGELVTASHVVFEPLPDDARLPPTAVPIADAGELVGREAARNLRAGQVLTTDLCLPPTMVRRGQLVNVTAAGGGIRITRQAVARADGRQGEVIEVETTDNSDRLVARVVGSGTLAIVTAVPPPEPPRTFNRTVAEPQSKPR